MFAHGKSMYMTERIFAFFQVLSFLLAPLYLMTNVLIVYVIIKDFDTMLVFISIPMLAVYAYNLIIPTWSPCFNTTWSRFTYYPKLVISVVYAPWILTLVQANSLLKSYLISWGKTIKVTHDYDEAAPQNVISNA
jgi:chitin synthase